MFFGLYFLNLILYNILIFSHIIYWRNTDIYNKKNVIKVLKNILFEIFLFIKCAGTF